MTQTTSDSPVRILTIGTGAIGSFYTWRMQQGGNCEVTTVCRSNYEVVKANGVEFETIAFGEGPHIFKPDHVVKTVPRERYDFIVVCMKVLPEVYSIPDIIAPAVEASPNAAIVLIQNGIGIEAPIKERFPRNPILSTIAYIGVTQHKSGVVYHSGMVQKLTVGVFEPIEGVDTESALQAFGDICTRGLIDVFITHDIMSFRWQKIIWNGTMAPICILSDLWSVSDVMANEKYYQMVVTTKNEIATLAKALGYNISPNAVETSMVTTMKLADGYKPSLVVDLEEGRPMEVEVILTNPIKIAEENNLTHLIPTWYKLYKDLILYFEAKKGDTKLIVGLRLQNVYDVNSRTYLFKFSKPDRKEMVLIESGIRMHTTLFIRDKSITPSGFCIKIRKHLRTRRLTGVKQLGSDRIVDFEFKADDLDNTYHIIAEFYAAGNLILTDGHYKILSILRVVQPNEKVRMAVGETYDISALTRSFEPIQKEHLVEVLKSAGPKDILKKVLNTKLFYGPALTEHAILTSELVPNTIVSTGIDTSDDSPQVQALFEALQEADKIIEQGGDKDKKGYIIMQKHKKVNENDQDEKELVTYDEFHPYLFAQHKSQNYKEFETFDSSVDEFFSAIESQRLEVKKRAQEEHAQKKLDSVRMEHFGRVRGLEETQQLNVLKAELIESNLEMCDQAIMIIRNAVATGMDWKDLADLVDDERRRGNPIALMIDSLKLESNNVCVILSDNFAEEEEDQEDDEQEAEDRHQPKAKSTVRVDLDIYLTAFANARKYYEVKKQSAIKQEKTLAHASDAFKRAEKKIRKQLQEVQITTTIQRARKPYWFEKFMWFITSENYLVIAGRDAQQNEMIVKRYLRKDDLYVHADIHGAATVVIKNPSDKEPVPPSSIYQAGIMSVCQSKAWDAKIVTSAYWVRADQVSKSAPSGEYLTTGSFMIRGKKNFLPPVQLVYGFGLLFKLDESSIANHLNERKAPKIEDAEDSERPLESEGTPKVEEAITADTQQVDEQDDQGDDGILEGSDGSDDEKEDNEDKSLASHDVSGDISQEDDKKEDQLKTQTGNDEDDEDNKSESEDESEAAESSDDEFPDTQIQFNTNAVNASMASQKQASADSVADKYGLQDFGDDSNDEADKNDDTSSLASSDKGNQQRSTYITAKMRRDMKKGKVPGQGGDESLSPQQSPKPAQTNKSQKGDQKKSAAQPTLPPAPVRGKKGKAKKMKERYGDQDEEERQLRLELLAPDKGPQLKGKRAKKEAKERAEKEALAEKRRVQQEQYQKSQNAKGGNKNNNNKKSPNTKATGAVQGQKTQTTDNTADGAEDETAPLEANANEDDAEEVRRLLQEENIKVLDAEETENLTVLDGLTGKPLPTDILQFAVPVCAPYGALQKYKYKVKLIPGTMKKGKSVKTAINHFLTNVNDTTSTSSSDYSNKTEGGLTGQELRDAEVAMEARERELIKMIKDEEAINAMIGKTKVSAPGVESSKSKSKAAKSRK
ncbi:hypothetical protein BGZ76_007890 [Entomortierella beljakovae]|nr:hypothetical protein BGZ76_007890 [Entomortierella beljakovae]